MSSPPRVFLIIVLFVLMMVAMPMPLRTAQADDSDGLSALVSLLGDVDDADFQLDLLNGMADALKGRAKVAAPKGWSEVAEKLRASESEAVRKKTAELSLRFGDGKAMERLIQQATDRNQKPEVRNRAIALLAEKRVKAFEPHLFRLMQDHATRSAAIEALSAYEAIAVASGVVTGFKHLPADQQQIAITMLCARASYADLLLTGLEEGFIPAKAVSAFHARQLQAYKNDNINQRLKSAWGELRTSSAENREQIARLTKVMTDEFVAKGNVEQGRGLFKKTCSSCHTLFDDGGKIGPNLTGANRGNLLYVLENVIDPSAAVAKDYTVTSIMTEDGRIISGIVGRQTDRTVEVQTLKDKIVLDRAEIEAMKSSPKSMMPDGLTEKMSDADIRDLIAYLRSKSQVALPANFASE